MRDSPERERERERENEIDRERETLPRRERERGTVCVPAVCNGVTVPVCVCVSGPTSVILPMGRAFESGAPGCRGPARRP